MTNFKAIVSAGLMLAVTGVALADPSVKLLPAGAKAGQPAGLVVKGYLGGATSLTAVEIHIKIDTTKLTVAATPVITLGDPNWGLATNLTSTGEIIVTGAYNLSTGQTTDGTICTISGVVVGSSKATLTGDTNIADQDGTPWYIPAEQTAAVINGAVKDLGAPILGAPSTGPGKVVAVAAGTTLQLLNAGDLSAVTTFVNAPPVGPVSGRPSFGTIGTQAVIAVGDDAGALTIVDAATGASVFKSTLGAKVSTPAIAADAVYAAVTPASGKATVVKVAAGTASPFATLAGSSVLGAPAVYGGFVAVGTDAGLEVLRPDGTQQATVGTGATVAPIFSAAGKGLSANATNLLGFNALTGNAGTPAAHGAGAVSEAWYDAATDTVVFGTPSGKILGVNLTSGAPTLAATALTTGAISAQPIVLNGVTYAIDANGNVASSAGLDAPLAAASAKALAATGRTAGTDSVIAATATGIVASIAF